MRPENLCLLAPATPLAANRPARTKRTQARFLRFLRVRLTHFLATLRPTVLRSIVKTTRPASDSVKRNVVPRFGFFPRGLAATDTSAVPFGSTAKTLFDSDASENNGATVSPPPGGGGGG